MLAALVGGSPVAELTCRWIDPLRISEKRHRPDAIVGFRLRPSGRADGLVNEDGIPNGAVPPTKEPNEIRVLCVGDSITAAATLGNREDRWTSVLEHELETALPGKPVRVINAGLEGYRVPQMRLLLEALAPKYDPDVVVILFQDASHGLFVPPDPQYRWRYALHNAALRSHLVETLVLASTGYDSWGSWPGEVGSALAPDGRKAVAHNLGGLLEYSEQHGFNLLFAIAPHADPSLPGAGEALGDEVYAAHRAAQAALQLPIWWPEHGTHLAALGDAAFGEGDARHLSRAGNTALARDLAATLLERNLLSTSGPDD